MVYGAERPARQVEVGYRWPATEGGGYICLLESCLYIAVRIETREFFILYHNSTSGCLQLQYYITKIYLFYCFTI